MYIVFCDNLYQYDPSRTVPITYFRLHFKGAVVQYLSKNNDQTEYFAKQNRKIEEAIQALEASRTAWTLEDLSKKSGMSIRCIQSAYQNQQKGKVDEKGYYFVLDDYYLPERVIDRETRKDFWALARDILDQEEYWLIKERFQNQKLLSFDVLSEISGIPPSTVRRRIIRGLQKISENEILMGLLLP